MSYKIITLSSNTRSDGSFSVNGVFWLVAPSNLIIPQPNIKSQIPNITKEDLSNLQSGTIVEQYFSTGLYVSGTILTDIQTDLRVKYDAAQTTLNNIAPAASGLVGIAYDGYSWTTPSAPLALPSQTVSVTNIPLTADGRWTVSPNAFPSWVTLYFAGRGDDSVNGIGKGPYFQMASDGYGQDGYGNTIVTWQFTDVAFILGAVLIFTGANIGDTIDYLIYAPPTTTGTGTTQVNLVNVGPGNIIVPASGTGGTTVDLTTVIPVPNQTNTGFWDCSDAITGKGTITLNTTQTGAYDLYDFTVPLGHPVVESPMIGSSKTFDLLVESVTALEVLPQWVHQATLHSGGSTDLQLGWTLAVARATTV